MGKIYNIPMVLVLSSRSIPNHLVIWESSIVLNLLRHRRQYQTEHIKEGCTSLGEVFPDVLGWFLTLYRNI